MLALAVLAGLAAAAPIKLAVPDFRASGLKPEQTTVYGDTLAQQFIRQGFEVVTSSQIATVLGQERQKQLLGCTDDSTACMAELASAMGSDALVSGSVSRIEGGYVLNMSIVSGRDGAALSGATVRATSETALIDGIEREALRMAGEIAAKLRPNSTFVAARPGFRRWALLPAGLAVVGGVAGAVLLALANDKGAQLAGEGVNTGRMFTRTGAQQLASGAQTEQTVAVAMAAASAIALIATVVVWAVGGEVSASLVTSP